MKKTSKRNVRPDNQPEPAALGVLADALRGFEILAIDGELALVLRLGRSAAEPVPELDRIKSAYRVKQPPGDTVGPFLAEVTLPASGARCRAGLLFESYIAWCDARGLERLSRVGFSRAIKARGFKQVHSNGGWWVGFVMIEPPEGGPA